MNVAPPPDRLYAELFEAVQSSRLLGDCKTFVDARAKRMPAEILAAFRAQRDAPGFDLGAFLARHFELPGPDADIAFDPDGTPVAERIDALWDLLSRSADRQCEHSSLIPLPNRYVVPGGRFREVYYWDSYFTMLASRHQGAWV